MPQSPIVLVGAGRSPHTKQLRRRKGFQQRTFYIGSIQIKSGLRIPVTTDFLKQHYDAIVPRIEAGTLLVEYKNDTFVDADELKTLAFGSDAEKEAYEAELRDEREAKVAKQTEASEARRADDAERARLSVLGEPIPGEDVLPPDTDPAGEIPDGVRLDGEKAPGDNFAGSHEEPITSPRQVADDLARTQQAQAESESEPEPEPAAASSERAADPDFKPLPDGWQRAAKPELLAWCEERGIDISDGPSNKDLRRRLEAYVARA